MCAFIILTIAILSLDLLLLLCSRASCFASDVLLLVSCNKYSLFSKHTIRPVLSWGYIPYLFKHSENSENDKLFFPFTVVAITQMLVFGMQVQRSTLSSPTVSIVKKWLLKIMDTHCDRIGNCRL